MSIVAYRSQEMGRVVYHDPTSQILVVHRDNSVELYGSNGFEKELESYHRDPNNISDLVHRNNRLRNYFSNSSSHRNCPSCGVDLGNFYGTFTEAFINPGHESFDNSEQNGRRVSSENEFTNMNRERGVLQSKDGESRGHLYRNVTKSPHFMHRDYFNLLANLPSDPKFTESGSTSTWKRALELPLPTSEARDNPELSELFNQGYFLRFFRKISPGILGSGAHAQVYKVAHVLKDIELGIFAVKRINVGDHLHFLNQVLNEVLILYELSAKGTNENNLIRYNHVWMEYGDLSESETYILNPNSSETVSKVPYVYILQQYCDGGHLENLISSNFQREEHMSMKERIDEERARRRRNKKYDTGDVSDIGHRWLSDFEIWKFFRDITNGVAYLHAHGILHRDLKPSNCLLESKYDTSIITRVDSRITETEFENLVSCLPKVLVSDFGEGKFMNKRHSFDSVFSLDDERRGNTGTIEFTDPRMWEFQEVAGHKSKPKFAHQFTYDSDVYSLGMILCYLCVGKLPFSAKVSNYNNPALAREEITKWHTELNMENFSEWFDRRKSLVTGQNTQASDNFKVMIYSMIKANPETPRPTSKLLRKYLESMKWEVFISGRNRSRSEATIVEMGSSLIFQSFDEENVSTFSGDDNEEKGDKTINFIDSHASEIIMKRKEGFFQSLRQGSMPIMTRLVYILNFFLLEKFVSPEYSGIVFVAKIGNAFCLACDNLIREDLRIYVGATWLLLSLWLFL